MSRLDAASLLHPSPPPTKPHRRSRLLPFISAVLGGAVVLFLFLFLRSPPNQSPNYGSLLLSLGSNDTAASHLRALTLHPHVAGTKANSLTAAYVLNALSSLSFSAHITPYSVLLSYPVHRSLSLSAPGRPSKSFSLSQDTYPNDPYAAAAAEVIPTFFAYSASGSVSAETVYANYGREEDFAYLASAGIDVAGKVALARYGRIHCEDIVHNARAAGAAAAVVYPDPLEYSGPPGEGTFPSTRWLPPTGVQVGSLFRGVGDPTTPMWASSEGCERVSVEDAMATDDMPGIPALPVSARDAAEIHRVLGGDVAPADWQGRDGSPVYRLGPGPAVLNLTYMGNDTMATIENVFAVIEGAEEPDRFQAAGRELQTTRRCRCRKEFIFYGNTYSAAKISNEAMVSTGCTLQDLWLVELFCIKPSLFCKTRGRRSSSNQSVLKGDKKATSPRYVILGNHRDAWTFGGADPNSGTAAMIELAQRFSMLQKQGWRPRRTIIFCSWDAEEYGLTGSTEWVEENREMLSSRAVAYLNVDCSVVGPVLLPTTTPQLDELLLETIKLVQDPDNSSQTVYDSWVKSNVSPKIGRLGDGGSDYAAFVQHVGIPSTSMVFGEGPGYPVYHSLYDDFIWMEKFADPGFRRHVAAASIWGIMALKLADEEVIPFNYMSYATELEAYTKVVEKVVKGMPVSCSPLYNSIKALKRAATKVNSERKEIQRELSSKQLSKDSMKIRGLNDRLMQAERALTNREGLLKQEWYKHLIYGPSEQNDWDTAAYPGIADAIATSRSTNTSASWKLVQHEIHRVARAVTQASAVLSGSLT